MALQSVANTLRREPDPYERIAAKLAGIQAVTAMANAALEHNAVTDKVWFPLWYFVSEVCDDIKQDAEELWRQNK